MAQTIEDVNGRTLLQQFHELYKKQDSIETNVENVDAKVDQEKSDRQTADENLQKAIYQEATARANADTTLQNGINTNATKIGANTTQISALQSGKQDKLTAGTNITIDANNVISASGGLTKVTASDVNSETATNGQVLTADGSGGASWQNASGGEKYYRHSIIFSSSQEGNPRYVDITTKSNTLFTMATLGQYLYNNNIILPMVPSYSSETSQVSLNGIAIKGTSSSDDDYFMWLCLYFSFKLDANKVVLDNNGMVWQYGSTLGHSYFVDNVSEL